MVLVARDVRDLWPGHVQRDTTSDGTLALGHSRSGFFALVAQQAEQPPCKRQAARSNRRRGHQTCRVRLDGRGHHSFKVDTRVRIPHAIPVQEPSSSSRFEGGAHFSDRGRRFRRDRGRRFNVIVDDHGSARVTGFIVSQPSTMTPKARIVDRSLRQACPRRRASLATNDRRGGQAVFAAASVVVLGLREAITTSPVFCASTRP